MRVSRIQERYAHKNEATVLRRVFELMDTKRDEKIDAEELAETFQRLSHKARKVCSYSQDTACQSTSKEL